MFNKRKVYAKTWNDVLDGFPIKPLDKNDIELIKPEVENDSDCTKDEKFKTKDDEFNYEK